MQHPWKYSLSHYIHNTLMLWHLYCLLLGNMLATEDKQLCVQYTLYGMPTLTSSWERGSLAVCAWQGYMRLAGSSQHSPHSPPVAVMQSRICWEMTLAINCESNFNIKCTVYTPHTILQCIRTEQGLCEIGSALKCTEIYKSYESTWLGSYSVFCNHCIAKTQLVGSSPNEHHHSCTFD